MRRPTGQFLALPARARWLASSTHMLGHAMSTAAGKPQNKNTRVTAVAIDHPYGHPPAGATRKGETPPLGLPLGRYSTGNCTL